MKKPLLPYERHRYARLAWFPPLLPGFEDMRPLSLASWDAMDLMHLALVNDDAAPSLEQARREMMIYLWLHDKGTPIADICDCLWDEAWQAIPTVDISIKNLTAFARFFSRNLLAIEASRISIAPKPDPSHGPLPPANLVGVVDKAAKLSVIRRVTQCRWSDEHILWHLWYPQALQIYHGEMVWNGTWTTPPVSHASDSELEDFSPDFGDDEESEDGTPNTEHEPTL